MVDTATSDSEVAGPIVHIMHAEVDETGTEPVTTRTTLALLTKDDLTLTVEEDTEELELAAERRRRRYRTFNEATLEVSSAMDVDMEALETVGLVDSNGTLVFDTGTRRITPNPATDMYEYIDVGYFGTESPSGIGDAQLVHRFEDMEAMNPEVDMSETPPLLSWEWMVHGAITLNHTDA